MCVFSLEFLQTFDTLTQLHVHGLLSNNDSVLNKKIKNKFFFILSRFGIININ